MDTSVTNVPMTPSTPSPTQLNPSLSDIDEFTNVIGMTLADCIREGAKTSNSTVGWGDGSNTACALTAAAITLNEKGYGIAT